MLPALVFTLGSTRVVLSTHPLMLALALLAGVLVFVRRAPDPGWGLRAAAGVAMLSVLGARGLHGALHDESATIGGGLSSVGGIASGLLGVMLAARLGSLPVAVGLDVLAPAGLLGLGLGRLGCLLAGCCYGQPTDLPWGIVVPEQGAVARHPLPLYDAVADLLLAALLARLPRRPPGRVARLACLGYGCVRAGLEGLRDPAAAELVLGGRSTAAQVVAAALALGALGAMMAAARWRIE